MRTMIRSMTLVLATAVALSGAAQAEEMRTLTANPSSLSASELDARIAFIEDRLDAHRTHAYRWQWGWVGIYGSGLVVQSIRAGLSEDNEHQADYVVSAIKAAGGVARMYFAPHPARNGADDLRAMEAGSREARARKLARAEELLLENAKFSKRRTGYKSHLGNILVNVAGGAIVWGLGAPSDALSATLVGIAVGTANILSAPWYGEEDLSAYEARFGGGSARGWDWKIVPTVSGAAVHVTF